MAAKDAATVGRRVRLMLLAFLDDSTMLCIAGVANLDPKFGAGAAVPKDEHPNGLVSTC